MAVLAEFCTLALTTLVTLVRVRMLVLSGQNVIEPLLGLAKEGVDNHGAKRASDELSTGGSQ